MIYIDQPVSTGFSPGNITLNDETDVAKQFMGFWKNFLDTFSMQGYKIYLTGESYAGQYIPYIASGMLDAEDETYYNVKGVHIMDPSINEDNVMIYGKKHLRTSWNHILTQLAPVVPALKKYQNVIGVNGTYLAGLEARAKSCGFTAFYDTYINQFPPTGKFPPAPSYEVEGCDLYDDLYNAIYYVNPCFNIYHLTDFCPFLWDELGFPSLGTGPNNYFNRTGKPIHSPRVIVSQN